MKQVTVEDKFGQTIDYMMISSPDDFAEYAESLGRDVEKTCARLINSDVPPDRWDHMIRRNGADSVVGLGIYRAKLFGGSIFPLITDSMAEKLLNMSRSLDEGEILLVNEVGGYCTYKDDYHTILTEGEYLVPDTYTIKKNTKYINLENDPDLEQHTIDYLNKVDENFSFVLNLREYPYARLTNVFKEFMENGGDTVYVYTTGLDVPQMLDYSAAIIDSGLKKVVFEFNCGKNDRHDGVIEHLEFNDVAVTVIGE